MVEYTTMNRLQTNRRCWIPKYIKEFLRCEKYSSIFISFNGKSIILSNSHKKVTLDKDTYYCNYRKLYNTGSIFTMPSEIMRKEKWDKNVILHWVLEYDTVRINVKLK